MKASKLLGISGISYVVGNRLPISALVERGTIGATAEKALAANGLIYFRESHCDSRELYISSVEQTLNEAGLGISDICGVVFAQPSVDWDLESETDLLHALGRVGFESGPVVGVALQGCSALAAVLSNAMQLVVTYSRPVLVIMSGLCCRGSGRYKPHLGTILSDGVSSAIVSSEKQQFSILSFRTHTNIRLSTAPKSSDTSRYLNQSYKTISSVVTETLASADVLLDDVKLFCGTNTNVCSLEFLSVSLGVKSDRMWSEDLREMGHLYSCDNLIALKNAPSSGRIRTGDIVLLVGWSPYTVGAVVVKLVS